MGKWGKRVRYGVLQYNEDDLDSALGSTGNARLVFMELIEKITAHIKMLRRIYTQKRYKNLFEALFAQERIYSLKVPIPEDIGWPDVSEQEVAAQRKEEQSGQPEDIKICLLYTSPSPRD